MALFFHTGGFVFGDLDSLAWDLGDPDLPSVANPNALAPLPTAGGWITDRRFHPMKGPMTTQTLRGQPLASRQVPFHIPPRAWWPLLHEDLEALTYDLQGGKTRLANLVRLCQFHHRLVHVLDLRLTLHPDRRLDVTFPAGNPIDRSIPYSQFVAPVPADPNLISSTWSGERLQLDYVHLAVVSAQRFNERRRSATAAA